MAEAKSKAKDYDERIYRKGHPPHRMRNALILIGLILIGTYLAVTKENPFAEKYEVRAVFENAANIRKDSPVRIAGVNVGKVQSVRSVGEAAEVTFTVDEEGQPIREDAQVEIRPRIFLEGNFFLDVKPGSPSGEEVPDGGVIPITQTSTAVQLDQILTTLQAPDRENLSKLLRGYGQALNYQPTAADDKGQDPDVQGETAAQAINDSFQYGAAAGRDSAIVSQALLGTEPGDLSKLIVANSKIFGALVQRETQLQDLVTNFNVTVGALASESENLGETVRLLAPTLEQARPTLLHTNETFPYLRALARDLQPGLRELPATIAASPPWLKQTRLLLGKNELGFIANELRIAAPGAAIAAAEGKGLFNQIELLSRCADDVLLPTGDVVLSDSGPGFDFGTGVPNYKEFAYTAANLAGNGQTFDGNGPFLRFNSGGGNTLVRGTIPNGLGDDQFQWGDTYEPPIGTRPVINSKPPFNSAVACHTNPVPDLTEPIGTPSPAQFP